MSHWNNFPACSFMTNFEIVVVPNERVQPERESLEQEELNAQQNHPAYTDKHEKWCNKGETRIPKKR